MPLFLEQVLWVDEKHKKCRLGLANDHEWLFFIDPQTGKLMRQEDGGVQEPPRPRTEGKFMNEARAVFGVSMTLDGQGKRMPLFDYSGKKVIGVAKYKKVVKAEILRVHMLNNTGKSGLWKDAGDIRDGGAYKAKYGDV